MINFPINYVLLYWWPVLYYIFMRKLFYLIYYIFHSKTKVFLISRDYKLCKTNTLGKVQISYNLYTIYMPMPYLNTPIFLFEKPEPSRFNGITGLRHPGGFVSKNPTYLKVVSVLPCVIYFIYPAYTESKRNFMLY